MISLSNLRHTHDIPTYSDVQRRSQVEIKIWKESMTKYLKAFKELGSFRMAQRPMGSNVLQSTYAFKKKRYPDGRLNKFTSGLCVRGDHQIENIDVFETYIPIISWITARLLLTEIIVELPK